MSLLIYFILVLYFILFIMYTYIIYADEWNWPEFFCFDLGLILCNKYHICLSSPPLALCCFFYFVISLLLSPTCSSCVIKLLLISYFPLFLWELGWILVSPYEFEDCCFPNFSCINLASLCLHPREVRYNRSSHREKESVSPSPWICAGLVTSSNKESGASDITIPRAEDLRGAGTSTAVLVALFMHGSVGCVLWGWATPWRTSGAPREHTQRERPSSPHVLARPVSQPNHEQDAATLVKPVHPSES